MKAFFSALTVAAALAPCSVAASDDRPKAPSQDDASAKPVVVVMATSETVPEAAGPRPVVLKTLYATSIALQVFDGYSTYVGMSRGNTELNPAMQGATPTTLTVAKATMTLTTIAIADQLWRQHHRGQAIAVMVVSNGLMAAVAAKNASVLR